MTAADVLLAAVMSQCNDSAIYRTLTKQIFDIFTAPAGSVWFGHSGVYFLFMQPYLTTAKDQLDVRSFVKH